MALKQVLKVTSKYGLTTRAAMHIVQTLSRYKSAIRFTVGENSADAKSMMGLVCLMAFRGAEVWVEAEGPDEEEAMAAAVKLFERKFGNSE